MVSSKETTPAAYLASLEPERRAVIAAVRTRVRKHLPTGFVEAMNWGMLCYEVPLARYPETYNKQPLMFVAIAAQKNNYALYLTNVHDPDGAHARLAAAYKAAGRKLDMGQSCLRFKSLDELPLDVIGAIIEETTVDRLIARYEASRAAPAKAAKKSVVKKSVVKKSAVKPSASKAATTASRTVSKTTAKQSTKKAATTRPQKT